MTTNVRSEIESLIAAVSAAIKGDRAANAAAIAAINNAIAELESSSGNSGGLTQAQAEALIAAKIAELVDGAPETLNTLKELADALDGQSSSVTSLLNAIGKRVSFGEAQTLTPAQMTTAQTNIGLGDWAGATQTLAQIFNTALAGES